MKACSCGLKKKKERKLMAMVYECPWRIATWITYPMSCTVKTTLVSHIKHNHTCPWGNSTMKYQTIWAKVCPVYLTRTAYVLLYLNTAFHLPLIYQSTAGQTKWYITRQWHTKDQLTSVHVKIIWIRYLTDIFLWEETNLKKKEDVFEKEGKN
jgi:hypothetical protein